MGKAMTKSQIADHLAGKAGVTKKTAKKSRERDSIEDLVLAIFWLFCG